jgi:hypothetical protein
METDARAEAAARDLSAFSAAHVFSGFGSMTNSMLFRGDASGDRVGPVISQFLWMDIPFGNKIVDQRYFFPAAGQAFLTKRENGSRANAALSPVGS